MAARGEAIHLAEVMAQAVGRWRSTPEAAWARVRHAPQADLVPPVQAGIGVGFEVLEQELFESLVSAGGVFRRLGRRGTIALGCGQDEQTVRLTMRADFGVGSREWRFARRPELGGARPRRRRGRAVLPARSWTAAGRDLNPRGDPICLLSPNPATVEMAKSLAAWLGRDLWTTLSLRQARQWLGRHPGCPLLLAETQEDEAGPQFWLSSALDAFGPAAVCLGFPLQTSALFAAAGKICRVGPSNAG